MPLTPTELSRLPYGRVVTEVRRLLTVEGLSLGQVIDRTGLPADHITALAGTRPTPTAPVPTVARPAGPGRPVVWLPAGALFVDAAYQRDLDPRWVRRQADQFDPALLGVLDVADRGPHANPRFAVVDGQHRLAVLRRLNPDNNSLRVACRIHTDLDPADEARLFGRIDASRRKLTGWDHWRARRATGDPTVAAIEDTIRNAGLRLAHGTGPGLVTSNRAAEQLHTLGGRPLLAATLKVLIEAWGREQLDFEVLLGTGLVLHAYTRTELPTSRLVLALSQITARQLKARARGQREVLRTSLPRLTATVVVHLVNDTRGTRWRRIDTYLTRAALAADTAQEARDAA